MQPFGRNRYGPKIGGAVPIWGRGAGSPSNTMWPGPRPTCVPSFVLIRPTVWPQCTNVTDRTDRTDSQDRQRTDSIGRTVLQTVAQKLCIISTALIKRQFFYIYSYIVDTLVGISYIQPAVLNRCLLATTVGGAVHRNSSWPTVQTRTLTAITITINVPRAQNKKHCTRLNPRQRS